MTHVTQPPIDPEVRRQVRQTIRGMEGQANIRSLADQFFERVESGENLFPQPAPPTSPFDSLPTDPAERSRLLRNILIQANQPIQTNLPIGASIEEQNAALEAQIRQFQQQGEFGLGVGQRVGIAAQAFEREFTNRIGGELVSIGQQFDPRQNEFEKNVQLLLDTRRDEFTKTIFGREIFDRGALESEAFRMTDFPSTSINIPELFKPFGQRPGTTQIPLGGGRTFGNVDIGVKGALQAIGEEALPLGLLGGTVRRTGTAIAKRLDTGIARLGPNANLTARIRESTILPISGAADEVPTPRQPDEVVPPPEPIITQQKPITPASSAEDFADVLNPTPFERDIFGFQPLKSGLTKTQRITNHVNDTLNKLPFTNQDDINDYIGAVLEEIELRPGRIRNVATAISGSARESIRNVFPMIPQNRIPSLGGFVSEIPGAPTISDVAARMPSYRHILSPDQIAALDRLRPDMERLRLALDEAGIEIGARTDIEEGGFYIPRGAAQDGSIMDMPMSPGGGRGDRSFTKMATQDSQAAGIEALEKQGGGLVFQNFDEVIYNTVVGIGTMSMNSRIANFMTNAVDPASGIRLGITQAERVDPRLRTAWTHFNNKARGIRQTVRNQRIRKVERLREAERAEGKQLESFDRLTDADVRAVQASQGLTQFDIRQIKADIRSTIASGKEIALNIGRNIEQLRSAKKALTKQEDALNDRILALRRELDEVGEQLGRFESDIHNLPDAFVKLDIRAQGLIDEIAEITQRFSTLKIGEQVEVLIKKGDLLQWASEGNREGLADSWRTIRIAQEQQFQMRAVSREVNLLKREMQRSVAVNRRAQARGIKATEKEAATFERYQEVLKDVESLRDDWRSALERAKRPGTKRDFVRTRGGQFEGLQGISFANEIVKPLNKVLLKDPNNQLLGRIYNDVNRLLVSVRATADLSAVGIQGLLGIGADIFLPSRIRKTQAFRNAAESVPAPVKNVLMQATEGGGMMNAIKVMFASLGTEDAYGAFINAFNDVVEQAGRLSAVDLAAKGLIQRGPQTEFQVGQGVFGKLATLPLVRQANRAFGMFGDTMRLQWVDNAIRDEMSRGRSLLEIESSGDLDRIIQGANRLTGATERRLLPSLGQIALFAPRFFQSRLEVIVQGAMGLQGFVPGRAATLNQRMARNSLLRLTAWGTGLTFGLNALLGNDTDTSPLTRTADGKLIKNPNFMRVTIGDRDFSVFGPYDSMAGMIISTAAGNPLDAFRQVSSPLIGQAWDIISRSNFEGDPIESPEAALQNFGEGLVPFSLQESPQIARDLQSGDIGGGAATIFGEIFGVKSSRRTISERLYDARGFTPEQWRGEGIPENMKLTPDRRDEIDARPEVKALLEERRNRNRRRQSRYQEYLDQDEAAQQTTYQTIETRLQTLGGPGREMRLAIDQELRDLAIKRRDLREVEFAEDLEFFADLEPFTSKEDRARTAYATTIFSDELTDPLTGDYNFKKREEIEAQLRLEFGEEIIDLVEAGLEEGLPQIVKDLRASRRILKPYWEIPEKYARSKGLEGKFDDYTEELASAKASYLLLNDDLDLVLKVASGLKKAVRESGNPAIQRELRRWGYDNSLLPSNPSLFTEGVDQLKDRLLELQGAGTR